MLLTGTSTGQLLTGACPIDVTTVGVVAGSKVSTAIQTANTAQLNALFASIDGGQAGCHAVYFPEGIYSINGPIIVNAAPVTITGVNRAYSVIQQTTANTPIFEWTTEQPGTRESIYLRDLGFSHSNLPASGSSRQVSLQFQCTSDGSGGVGYGFHKNTFERLAFQNNYVGIGLFTQNGGRCSVWSTDFRDLLFYSTKHSAIQLISSGAIGQPALVFDSIAILNTDTSLLNDGPAMAINSGNGMTLRSIDVENWHNTAIEFYGGVGTIFQNPRIEHEVLDGNAPSVLILGNNDFILQGLTLSFDGLNHTGTASIISLASGGGPVSLESSSTYVESTVPVASKVVELFHGDPTVAKVNARGTVLQTGLSEWLPSAFGPDLFLRVTDDGLPPAVDKLPAPSSAYAGRAFTVTAADSRADQTYQCVNNGSGAYSWAPMH